MNKAQLIEAIANDVDITKAAAAACVDAFINNVTKVQKKKILHIYVHERL